MDLCNKLAIPTLYFLDDNWFCIAKEWPEYAEIFAETSPLLQAACYCIERANAFMTFNSLIAQQVQSLAKKIEIMSCSIDISLFKRKNSSPSKSKFLIGYAGSVRKEAIAFEALIQIAKERDDFDILFFTNQKVPDSFNDIDPKRFILKPYIVDYPHYASLMTALSPDILLAPLGTTQTEASKCPNKYLEIAACKAAGIYSNLPPYTQYVEQEKTGLLVENTCDAWKEAILRLMENNALRQNISQNAHEDMLTKFETSVVLPQFVNMLQRTLNSVV
jgi:glycosyltransferase involved in cell wall biosynthesis